MIRRYACPRAASDGAEIPGVRGSDVRARGKGCKGEKRDKRELFAERHVGPLGMGEAQLYIARLCRKYLFLSKNCLFLIKSVRFLFSGSLSGSDAASYDGSNLISPLNCSSPSCLRLSLGTSNT